MTIGKHDARVDLLASVPLFQRCTKKELSKIASPPVAAPAVSAAARLNYGKEMGSDV